MPGSKHYTDEALDVRSKTLTHTKKTAFMAEIRRRLGENYQVILEHEHLVNEHFHIEWDPR